MIIETGAGLVTATITQSGGPVSLVTIKLPEPITEPTLIPLARKQPLLDADLDIPELAASG